MKALVLLICLFLSPLTYGHVYGVNDECKKIEITTPLVIPADVKQVYREAVETDDRIKRLEGITSDLESRVKSLELMVKRFYKPKSSEL